MKKERWLIIGVGLAMVMLVSIIIPVLSFSADMPMKWKFATVYPRGSDYQKCYHGFCEMVKSMSGGRLLIEDIYEGEGVTALEILSSIKSGLIEMGAPYMAFHAGEIPAGIIELGLPGAPVEVVPFMTLFNETDWKKILRNEYAKHNIYWLSPYFQAPMMLLTKKPINSLNDLSKMKIRSPGAYGKMLKNLGAAPVTIAFAEIYTSLATGVIDGVGGSPFTDLRDGRFYEVAKYMYPLPLVSNLAANVVVNLSKWNALPDDLKTILEAAGTWHCMDQATKSFLWNQEAWREMQTKGAKWSPSPSEADRTKWKKAQLDLWAEYEAKDETSKELIRIQREFMKRTGL